MKLSNLIVIAFALVSASANAQLYTQTNEAAGNRIAEIRVNPDGSFVKPRYFGTAGLGSGNGLGIQGAVALTQDRRFLLAVNAGSNEISVFRLGGEAGAVLVSKAPSGGTRPVSVTTFGDLVYVVNATSANIAGLYINPNGQLQSIPESIQPLSTANAAPGQISFNPEGDALYVTEKNNNRITYFSVDTMGLASAPQFVPSPGSTPFGFGFGRRGKLIVTEAFPGIMNASAVSAFTTNDSGRPTVAAATIPTFQTAACWLAVTKNGKFAYAANAASESIAGYRIYDDGTLALLSPNGISSQVSKGSGATDLAVDESNGLWMLAPRAGGVVAFSVDAAGKLTRGARIYNLPRTVTGLVYR